MVEFRVTELERILLERSLDIEVHRRRSRRSLLVGLALVVLLITVYLSSSQHRAAILFWSFLVYVLLATWGHFTHHVVLMSYKRLVQKLVTALMKGYRVDGLEAGVQSGEDGGVGEEREAIDDPAAG